MKAELRDITRPLTEAIVCPANGIGVMSRGAARSIAEIAGPDIELEARAISREAGAPLEAGTCYATRPYKLARRGVKRVYHVVTIKYPGGVASLDSVNKGIRAVFDRAVKDKVKSIAIPGLGTGSGRLDKGSVARMLVPIARNYSHAMEIKFADLDKEFINELDFLLGGEKQHEEQAEHPRFGSQ